MFLLYFTFLSSYSDRKGWVETGSGDGAWVYRLTSRTPSAHRQHLKQCEVVLQKWDRLVLRVQDYSLHWEGQARLSERVQPQH